MKFLSFTVLLLSATTLIACYQHTDHKENNSYRHGYHHEKMSVAMLAIVDEFFKKMDTNQDGKITREERNTAPHQHMLMPFDKIDSNQDGLLSLDEYRKTVLEKHSEPKGMDV